MCCEQDSETNDYITMFTIMQRRRTWLFAHLARCTTLVSGTFHVQFSGAPSPRPPRLPCSLLPRPGVAELVLELVSEFGGHGKYPITGPGEGLTDEGLTNGSGSRAALVPEAPIPLGGLVKNPSTGPVAGLVKDWGGV